MAGPGFAGQDAGRAKPHARGNFGRATVVSGGRGGQWPAAARTAFSGLPGPMGRPPCQRKPWVWPGLTAGPPQGLAKSRLPVQS